MTTPLEFIKTVRESFGNADYVYLNGSCYHFYKILKQVFPKAEAYFNSDHVITKIDGKYYDITGVVKKTNHIPVDGNYNVDMLELMICKVTTIETLSSCASV